MEALGLYIKLVRIGVELAVFSALIDAHILVSLKQYIKAKDKWISVLLRSLWIFSFTYEWLLKGFLLEWVCYTGVIALAFGVVFDPLLNRLRALHLLYYGTESVRDRLDKRFGIWAFVGEVLMFIIFSIWALKM